MHYRRTKRDANHRAIVEALEKAGFRVVDLAAVGGGIPDVIVGVRGRNLLLEVKNAAARGGKKRGAKQQATLDKQAEFRANWTGQAAVVYSIDEALYQVGCV